ncbi:DoxX family protein [Ornithinimicrobium cryptoxanthini]|uniref:DoxX family protein n=1 Tax=Ornithinimicrobium cryptoxanthini TaxID=2934161 RepID=A0ABY4YIU5_9MICO|nr:DoxX family protein [Ornithinimicrobium cryptoxanthini]USQ76702.1 DoxX family protein [Ornithinimicrobium cryptoxanthini]
MDVVVLIARVLFVVIFLASGIGHLKATEAMAGYAQFKNVPAPKLSTIVSGVLMVVGALSVLLGVWGDLGSLLLLVAIAPIPFLMHRYWNEEGEAKANEQVQFNKTLSLVGGALALFALFVLVPDLGLTITEPLFTV